MSNNVHKASIRIPIIINAQHVILIVLLVLIPDLIIVLNAKE